MENFLRKYNGFPDRTYSLAGELPVGKQACRENFFILIKLIKGTKCRIKMSKNAQMVIGLSVKSTQTCAK